MASINGMRKGDRIQGVKSFSRHEMTASAEYFICIRPTVGEGHSDSIGGIEYSVCWRVWSRGWRCIPSARITCRHDLGLLMGYSGHVQSSNDVS